MIRDFEEQAALNERMIQITENLMERFPLAADGPAHCVVSDGNVDHMYLKDEIEYIQKIMAWRFLVLESPQDIGAMTSLAAEIEHGGRHPLSYMQHSDTELAATLGVLFLLSWLWENA